MSESAAIETQRAVVIGASAGVVDALMHLLPLLPKEYPLPILIVVHLPPDVESTLASLLDARSEITVKEAEDKEPIRPGMAYVAPPNYHMQVEPDYTISLSSDDPVLFCRPAIDVLFQTAADSYGTSLAGIVLTGSNADGAEGLRAVEALGGLAIVQSQDSAAFPDMPKAAQAACTAPRIVSLHDLGNLLKNDLPRLLT